MDGWMDGWMDGRTDGQAGRQTDRQTCMSASMWVCVKYRASRPLQGTVNGSAVSK